MSVRPPNVHGAPAHRPAPSAEIEMRTVTTPSGRSVTADTKAAGAGDRVPSHTMAPKEDPPPPMTQHDRISLAQFEARQKAAKTRHMEVWTEASAKSEAMASKLKENAGLPLPARNALISKQVDEILAHDKPREREIAAGAIFGSLRDAKADAVATAAVFCRVGSKLGVQNKFQAQRMGGMLSGKPFADDAGYKSALLSEPELGLRLSVEPTFAFRMGGTAQQKVQWLAIACQNKDAEGWASMAREQISKHAPEAQRAGLSAALETLVGSGSHKPESKSQSAQAVVVRQPAPALPKALLFNIGTGVTPLRAVDEALAEKGMQGALTPDHCAVAFLAAASGAPARTASTKVDSRRLAT